ncbi:MAG: hypothetical protein RIS35_1283, partial [Pseudomonadota bacterium]
MRFRQLIQTPQYPSHDIPRDPQRCLPRHAEHRCCRKHRV